MKIGEEKGGSASFVPIYRPASYAEGFLVIPRYFSVGGQLPSFSEIFGNSNRVEIEFCSGNGEWIARCAEENPGINYIGVEMKFARAQKILAKKEKRGLKNLLVVCGKGEDLCEHYLPENFASAFYINFPDPWPKKRHAKHRIVKEEFIDVLGKIAQEGAPLWVVSDDEKYVGEILEILGSHRKWQEAFPFPHYVEESTTYGSSYFNRLWLEKGKKIHYIKYCYCEKRA